MTNCYGEQSILLHEWIILGHHLDQLQAYLYDGKTGDMTLELGSPAHKGGIYGVAFSGNGKEVLTVSGDKTAKIWNVDTGEIVW